MSKEERREWRAEHRPGAIKAETFLKEMGKFAEKAVLAQADKELEGGAKFDLAVDQVAELLDAATPFPEPAEMISDFVIAVAKPAIKRAVQKAFDKLRKEGRV